VLTCFAGDIEDKRKWGGNKDAQPDGQRVALGKRLELGNISINYT